MAEVVAEEAAVEKKEPKTEEKTMAYNETKTENTRPAVKTVGNAIELKVVRPESFNAVGQIADYLLNHCTVVLNLEGTNKETARRLIDFLSGVAYSIDGQLKRVANNTFVITPHNVDVSGDQLRGPEPKPEPKSPIDEDDIYSSEL